MRGGGHSARRGQFQAQRLAERAADSASSLMARAVDEGARDGRDRYAFIARRFSGESARAVHEHPTKVPRSAIAWPDDGFE
jgi:hypothetical protein